MSEKNLQYKLGSYLKRWFNVYYEVWSCDYKKRIDIVIVHKSDTDYKYPFGIELKVSDFKRGKNIGEWLKQSFTYSKKDFVKFGKLIILVFPRISEVYLKEGSKMHQHTITQPDHNINTFLGALNIGEFQKDNNGKKRIVFSGSVLWTENNNDLRIHNIQKVIK